MSPAPLEGAVAHDVLMVQAISAVPTILEVVCRTTGMGFAAVARVTDDRWVACSVNDLIGFGLKPGGELKVETTICSEIRAHHQPVVIEHVAQTTPSAAIPHRPSTASSPTPPSQSSCRTAVSSERSAPSIPCPPA